MCLALLVRPTRANVERILRALVAFGYSPQDLQVADFLHPDGVTRPGYPRSSSGSRRCGST